VQHLRRIHLPKGRYQTETFLELPFKVDSIATSAAPVGAQGLWHSYVISQGTNVIRGVRAGTHAEVSMLLAGMVERLNERRAGKRAYR
jgi:hypothetical protein